MNHLPAYLTRDLVTEAARRSLPSQRRNDGAVGISAKDATAALQYAHHIRDVRFENDLRERRRRHGIPEGGLMKVSVNVRGFPLGNRGKLVYEAVRKELNMSRFGADAEYRAIIERLLQMGAKL